MSIPRWLIVVMLGAALIGFGDASYLTAQHILGVLPPCAIDGCDQVLVSKYASIGGVPVSVLGMVYYGAMVVLLIAYFDTGNRRILHGAAWLTAAGFLGTLYFVSIQVFVLHAICLYCMGSALTSAILFIAGIRIMRTD